MPTGGEWLNMIILKPPVGFYGGERMLRTQEEIVNYYKLKQKENNIFFVMVS